MGRWASIDLANNDHSVPTVSMSVTDPVASGVIPDPYDSGLDHLHKETQKIAFNKKTAEMIDYQYSESYISRVYKVFSTIAESDSR